MVPHRVLVDPGQLVGAFRSISKNFLSDVDIEPYRFVAADVPLSQVSAIAGLLAHQTSPDQETVVRLKYLFGLLSSKQQEGVLRIAQSSTPSEGDRSELVGVLNTLVEFGSLAEKTEFAGLFAPPRRSPFAFFAKVEPNPLAEMKKKFGEDSHNLLDGQRRLNRLLVWQALKAAMPAPELTFAELETWEPMIVSTQSLSAPEGFMIWMKAAIITGLFLASPWMFIQVWTFVAAGLYPHEQRYVYIYLPLSMFLFIAGACLAFFFVFDPVLGFLLRFNASMGIEIQPRIGDWLSFVMFLPLGFGIAFQLPLVMLFLNWMGIFTLHAYLDKWRVSVLVIAFLSMILTPADPISMLLMAVPLTALYFLGIGLCRWMPRRQSPYGEANEP